MSNGKLVVNIVCLGHSGSTLLGNVLGAHQRGLHIGEIISPIKKGKPIVCRSCLDKPCPIWGTILTEKFIRDVYDNFLSKNILNKIFNSQSGSIYKKLFEAFKEIDFVVDSSKNIPWYRYNALNRTFRYKYIFVKRNPSAVIASYKRAYEARITDYIPVLKKGIQEQNSFYANLSIQEKHVLNYEDLAVNPVSELKAICNFLEVEYDPQMMNFNDVPHHLIGGNHGLLIQNDHSKVDAVDQLIDYKTPKQTIEYYKSLNGFRLDERWKTELTEEEQVLVNSAFSDSFSY